jgi:hypothetical protein
MNLYQIFFPIQASKWILTTVWAMLSVIFGIPRVLLPPPFLGVSQVQNSCLALFIISYPKLTLTNGMDHHDLKDEKQMLIF